jgi:hypothetical protein
MSARAWKTGIWILLVALVAGLSGGCGGIGDGANATADAGAAPESHVWDSWKWDEGSFAD